MRFDEKEIKWLTLRFWIDIDDVIYSYWKCTNNVTNNEESIQLENVIKTLRVFTVEYKRRFSQMNIIMFRL